MTSWPVQTRPINWTPALEMTPSTEAVVTMTSLAGEVMTF